MEKEHVVHVVHVVPKSPGLLLDPYDLLGVTTNSTPDEVRRAYYSLSLIAHPDKGGSAEQMSVVYRAYKFVEEQISISSEKNRRTVEELISDFNAYCVAHKDDRYESTDIRIRHALIDHAAFANLPYEAVIQASVPGGYGSFMLPPGMPRSDVGDNEGGVLAFSKEIVPFVEPEPLPAEVCDVAQVSSMDDYSTRGLCDYRSALNEMPEVLPHAAFREMHGRPLDCIETVMAKRCSDIEFYFRDHLDDRNGECDEVAVKYDGDGDAKVHDSSLRYCFWQPA